MHAKENQPMLSDAEFSTKYGLCFGTVATEKMQRLTVRCSLLQSALLALQDEEYRAFHSRLMPNVPYECVIGVRTPQLRALARLVDKWVGASDFMQTLPHFYYEENNLHAFLIEQIGDYSRTVQALDCFLPYVDNWATCDMMRPKVLKKCPTDLRAQIRTWINSEKPFAVRYGIETLMCYYLDEMFAPQDLAEVCAVRSNEYYVHMMVAWYFATALAKQYAATLPYIVENRLSDETHNRAIQKALESRRLSAEQKAYLRTLKRK